MRTTEPLRRELAPAPPHPPVPVTVWGGTRPPATRGGRLVLPLRSPEALPHVPRAPGQLGVGRAYVSGALEAEDLEAVLPMLESFKPPPLDLKAKLRLAAAAARATGPMRPPPVPTAELRPRGR